MGRLRTALVTVAAVAIASCGSGAPAANEERPLEPDDAARLANVLFDNHDAGGAAFTYTGQLGEHSLVLEGEIDFVTHQGRATVSASGPESAIVEVVWSDGEVIERIPGLADEFERVGRPGAEWVLREPDIDRRELDSAIALIVGLASEQRDNPQLILQTPGSVFMRTQPFRGAEVDVLRYGQRNSYWLDATTDQLLRFEGNNDAGSRPRIVDLRDYGPRVVSAPRRDTAVAVELVADAYEAVRSVP